MDFHCIECQSKSLTNRFDRYQIPEFKQEIIRSSFLHQLSEIDLETTFSPEVTRNLFAELRLNSNIPDPYTKEKKESNLYLLSKYDEFKTLILNSKNPFDTALRLAIAGNIIDFGPAHQFDVDSTIELVLNSEFAIDHSVLLQKAISGAKNILYLGDNAGEIVLDKLFIETIAHPNLIFAVRENPILNDATLEDARMVGLDKLVKVISNGDDSPSTLLHRVNDEFKSAYQNADLIISKGMGNYEGLMLEKDDRIFFLLMIKCHIIGKYLDAPKGGFVVSQNNT